MKFKFWSVQDGKVADIIKEEGRYVADFGESPYLKERPEMEELYDFMLSSFNDVNRTSLPGLVYAFTYVDNRYIQSLEEYNNFKNFIREKADAVGEMWQDLDRENAVILELEYDLDFEMVALDVNDWQALMPPQICAHPYTAEVFDEIEDNISRGLSCVSRNPSYLMQVHLPYIEEVNLIQVHPMFRI